LSKEKSDDFRDHTARNADGGGRPAPRNRRVDGRAEATPTVGVVPAAADEVSALTATQFSTHATTYQSVTAQAAAIHEMFVRLLGASAGSYATTEAANAIAAG
jgi:PE family